MYHELNLQWDSNFKNIGVILQENERYTKTNMKDRFEWKFKNASKIFS